MLHRTGLADNLATAFADRIAGSVGIRYGKRNMAETVAQLVGFRIPVVGQFEDGCFRLITVADEGKREAPVRIVLPAQ